MAVEGLKESGCFFAAKTSIGKDRLDNYAVTVAVRAPNLQAGPFLTDWVRTGPNVPCLIAGDSRMNGETQCWNSEVLVCHCVFSWPCLHPG